MQLPQEQDPAAADAVVESHPAPRGPVDASVVPRFAGIATFARLPRLDEVGRAKILGLNAARFLGIEVPAHQRIA